MQACSNGFESMVYGAAISCHSSLYLLFRTVVVFGTFWSLAKLFVAEALAGLVPFEQTLSPFP